jgi:S-formylglutathione hydrolase FrmB
MAYDNPTDARDQQVKLYLNDYYKAKAKRLALSRKKQLATFLYEELVKALEALEQEERLSESNAA